MPDEVIALTNIFVKYTFSIISKMEECKNISSAMESFGKKEIMSVKLRLDFNDRCPFKIFEMHCTFDPLLTGI